ncbi:M15 family metallopeptidase [Mycolicibacterium sp. 22603]|uniref:M15 family metallopeptidase n=1 Tax=Mycolicibacterium sp. 22603 TaxID=3453950 RepID=UPI003F855358
MRAVLTVGMLVTVLALAPVAHADPAEQPDRPLTAFDISDPAIANLDPALRTAVQNATTAAGAQGVSITVNSGWRSPQFQRQLLEDAIVTYGSFEIARQYVQLPEQSRHVVGAAVDIGGPDAAQWMIANGPRFGLCQIYANETWHFELVADAGGSCPPLLPNAAG